MAAELNLGDNILNMLAMETLGELDRLGLDSMLAGSQEDAHARADEILTNLGNEEAMRRNDEGEEYGESVDDLVGDALKKAGDNTAQLSEEQYQELSDSVHSACRRETDHFRRQADMVYFAGASMSERGSADAEAIRSGFGDTKNRDRRRGRAARAVMPDRSENLYQGDTLTTSDGKSKKYKVVQHPVDWGSDFKDGDIMHNMEFLTRNGIQYIPVLNGKFEGRFPLDCYSFLQNGCLAAVFDWGMLRRMKNLVVLDIDDMNLYVTAVADGLGLSRRIGARSLFRVCPRLRILAVGGKNLLAEDVDTKKGVEMKKAVAREKHFVSLFDGVNVNICQASSGLNSWTWGNLRDYACNRGNKGLFRYMGGIAGRALIAAPVGVLNIGTHVVRNIAGIAKNTITKFKDASDALQVKS